MIRIVLSVTLLLSGAALTGCGNLESPLAPSMISSPRGPTFATADAAAAITGGTFRTTQVQTWTASEQSLANYVSTANQGIIQLSALEANNGDNQQVKFLAFEILQDYSAAQDHLRDIGGSQVPQSPSASAADQQMQTTLSSMTGSGLDRAYIQAVLALFQANTAGLRSRDVSSSSSQSLGGDGGNAWGRATKYYALARDLAGRVGATVSDTGSGSGTGSTSGT